MKLTSLAQVLSFFLLAPCSTLAAEQSPNVVFVITDDQGYGDLGFTGNPVIKTPHLDKLAGESVWLEDFHVAPSCSPTRSSMLTGRWTNRMGVWHTFFARAMMYEDEVTIADHFQAAGYSTGMFGKWHLGDHYPYRPQDRGFDETYCIRGETAGGGVPAVSQTAEVASTRSGLLGVPVAILVELAIGAVIVQPETVIRWHRQGFKLYWRWKSRRGRPGRPPIEPEIRELIRRMSRENATWAHPESCPNCFCWATLSPKRPWPSTWSGQGSHRLRPGGRFWTITCPISPLPGRIPIANASSAVFAGSVWTT